MAVRKLKLEKMINGGSFPKLEFSSDDLEKLAIDDNRAFYAVEIDVKIGKEKNVYSLWKLHRIIIDTCEVKKGYKSTRDEDKIIVWVWLAMWSSSSWTSIKKANGQLQNYFSSMKEALKAAVEDNWKVCQVDYKSFENVICQILNSHDIRMEK